MSQMTSSLKGYLTSCVTSYLTSYVGDKLLYEVLKMLPSVCGFSQHFQDLGHSFFTINTNSKPANNLFIFFLALSN